MQNSQTDRLTGGQTERVGEITAVDGSVAGSDFTPSDDQFLPNSLAHKPQIAYIFTSSLQIYFNKGPCVAFRHLIANFHILLKFFVNFMKTPF